MAKSTHISLQTRVQKVAEMLLNGQSRADIVQYVSKKWNVTDRQADNYVAKAKDEIEKSITRKVEYNFAKAERRFEVIFQKSMAKGDLKTALATTRELATLQGLYKTEIEHTGEVIFNSNI